MAWNCISGFILKGGFSAAARSLFCQFGVFKRRKLPIHLFCVLFHRVWSHVDLLLSAEFFSFPFTSYFKIPVSNFLMVTIKFKSFLEKLTYLFSCTCIFTAWYRIGWANKDLWLFLAKFWRLHMKARWYTYKVYRSLLKKTQIVICPAWYRKYLAFLTSTETVKLQDLPGFFLDTSRK